MQATRLSTVAARSRAGTVILVALLAAAMSGCNPDARGFVLPRGDVDRGREAFVELGCNACHHIPGVVERLDVGAHPQANLRLGGPVTKVKTYGELVTAVIHPQYRTDRSPQVGAQASPTNVQMPDFNSDMTVRQLVDLVTFLQDTYTLYIPDYY